jgi:hypothetical protein
MTRILFSKKDIDYSIYQKLCIGCNEEKPASCFCSKRSSRDGLHPYCKECNGQRNREYRGKNKEALSEMMRLYGIKNREAICQNKKDYYRANKAAARDWQLKRHYGISLKEYGEMFEAQGGGCAICGSKGSGVKGRCHHVDHDHVTRRVRGLLCSSCNRGIGFAGDDVFLLQLFIEYLLGFSLQDRDILGRSFDIAARFVNSQNGRKMKRRELKVTEAQMAKLHSGACHICGQTFNEERLCHVDHDHSTGMVRGILCTNCNLGLGAFKDSVVTIQKAILYLQRHCQD